MFLIATLSCKENELSECIKSTKIQVERNEQIIFEGLDNVTAHKTVYSLFSQADEKYSYFCKLDADMKFNDEYVLTDVTNYFNLNPHVDHVILPVYDHFTNMHMLGIHFFRHGVKWNNTHEKVFVDPNPSVCGKKIVLNNWKNRVDHCFNPSSSQAMLFGIHRFSKMEHARNTDNISQFVSQLLTLRYSYLKYLREKDNVSLQVLKGCYYVICGELNHGDYAKKNNFKWRQEETDLQLMLKTVGEQLNEPTKYLNLKQKCLFLKRKAIHLIKLVVYGYI